VPWGSVWQGGISEFRGGGSWRLARQGGKICWMFEVGTFKRSDLVRGSAYAKCTMAGQRSCNVQWR
jgi:hypothetical protein